MTESLAALITIFASLKGENFPFNGGNGIPSSVKEGKQAEFLAESSFSWHLIEQIGVHSAAIYKQVIDALPKSGHRPQVEIKRDWYY